MAVVHHESTIAAPIGQVFSFFTDPVKNLPRISPPSSAVVIESADLPMREGSRITIAARDPLGRRINWESLIETFIPPHPVVFGMEARFVDVQLSGPFAEWRHAHEFEAVDAKTTRMVDHVTYTPPFGLLGRIADPLLIRWFIRSMLRHRHKTLRDILEQR